VDPAQRECRYSTPCSPPYPSGGSQQSARVDSTLTLDASHSYDTDQANHGASGLSFAWTCSLVDTFPPPVQTQVQLPTHSPTSLSPNEAHRARLFEFETFPTPTPTADPSSLPTTPSNTTSHLQHPPFLPRNFPTTRVAGTLISEAEPDQGSSHAASVVLFLGRRGGSSSRGRSSWSPSQSQSSSSSS